MTRPLLPDTDVLVDLFRGYSRAVSYVNENADRIVLSAVVVAELYAGVKGEDELRVVDDFVALFPILPVDGEVAKAGGLYRRDYGKSHGIGLADALIAATVEASGADLGTLNVRHYPMFRGLKSAYRKSSGTPRK